MSRTTTEIKKRKTNSNLGKTGILKRGLALLLAVLMTESVMVNAGLSYARAQEVSVSQGEAAFSENTESESGAQNVLQEYRILGFGELPEEIQVQTLPVGAKETDVEFPDQLIVTAEEILTSDVKDKMNDDDSLKESEKTESSGENAGEEAGKEDVGQEDTEKKDTEEDTEKEDPKEDSKENSKEDSEEENSKEEGVSGEDTEKETGEKKDASQGESAGEEPAKEEQGKGEETGTENTGETIITQAAAAWERFTDVFRPMTVYAAELEGSDPVKEQENNENTTEGETVELTLTGIEWKLDPAESDFPVFDGKKKGSVYTYTPVLPEINDDGTPIILHENAELPVIYVLVGEMQVSLLANGGEYKLDDLPVNRVNGSYEFVINSGNMDTYNYAVLTGRFSDFQDNGTTIKSSWKGIVIDGVEVNLTIRDVTIDRYLSSDDKWESTDAAITLTNGALLNLTLEGDNYLEGATGGAGICVKEGCTLRITRESNGKLKAVGGDTYGGAAGIGANGNGWTAKNNGETQKLGHIVIDGGSIEAVGGTCKNGSAVMTSAAGIGGSADGTTGSIEINGGMVTATGGRGSAGIGGGCNGWVPSITVSGGTITAITPESEHVKYEGAAIGAGIYVQSSGEASCGTIRISGGNIIAKGNIGHGSIKYEEQATKTGSVEIGENVTLTCDGRIDPGPVGEVTTYNLSFTIYDGRFTKATQADLSLNGTRIAQNVAVAVNTPGTAVIKTSVISGALTGKKSIQITIDNRNYDVQVDFQAGKTEYSETIGTALYPVTLEFYDPAIIQNITVDTLEVKQDGSVLDKNSYYAPAQITWEKTHYGTMVLYLPEGTSNTEISMKASSLNQGKSITKSAQSVSTVGDNTILMLEPHISLNAELLDVNQGQATLRIISNYAGITLWYLEKNEKGVPEPKEVIDGNTKKLITQTTKEIDVQCNSTSQHYFYLVAELGGVTSEVIEVSFSSEPSVELIKKGETQGVLYDSLQMAVKEAVNYPGCTVKLLKGITLTDTNIICQNDTILTIDLNGKTINIQYPEPSAISAFFIIYPQASVTLTDSSSGKSGTIKGNIGGKSLFEVNGTLVVQGGTFEKGAGNLKGRGTIRIEGGEFYNDVKIGSQNHYSESLSGGTFHGTISTDWGATATILKRGHRYKSLDESHTISEGSTEDKLISNVEVFAQPPIKGKLTLSDTECEWGQTITATYTPADGETGEKYIYRWYTVDKDGKITELETDNAAEYYVRRDYVDKNIYCVVEAEGTNYSGSVQSSGTVKVLGKDIARATSGTITKNYTGKPVILTTKIYIGVDKSGWLTQGKDFEIDVNSYRNNIEPSTADSKASVTIRGIGKYRGEYTLSFTIAEKDIQAEATVSPNDWTNQSVTVSAPEGYTICKGTDAGYDYENGFKEQSFTVTEESVSPDGTTVSYRLRDTSDGAISAEKQITVKIDRIAPDFDGEGDGIRVENNIWKQFLNKITFGTYTRTKDVTIKASDAVSRVAVYYYYVDTVADKENYQILSKDILDGYVAAGHFTENTNGKFSLSDAENQVVYAYAVDHAGNRSDYICTEGLVLDTKAPGMTITEPKLEDGTLKDTEVTITVELEEDAVILFFYERESRFKNVGIEKYKQYVDAVNNYMMNSNPQYPQFLKNENGKLVPTVSKDDSPYGTDRYQYRWNFVRLVDEEALKRIDISDFPTIVYRAEGKKDINNIILDERELGGLDPDTNYTVWIAAVDPAGNIAEQHFEFRTAKSMPKIETLPVVSGVYGDAAQDLQVAQNGIAKYKDEVINGTWKVTDTGTTLLPMDGTAKCKVTFTPDVRYDGKYESVVFEVTPTLAKRPVEVVIRNPSKTYGMKMPLLCEYATINKQTQNGAPNGLVISDDKDSLLDSLRWVTNATKDSPAGQYELTVTSDSPKYEVTAVYYDVSTRKYDKSKGILTITKAPGELEKTADFRAVQAVQYQGGNKAAFRLGVQANHNETPLHYEVTNAVDGNGNEIANENISSQLLTIAADGTVTPKGVGSAAITVSLPECDNYTAAADTITVRVNITKGDVVPSQVETAGTLTYGEPLSNLDFAKSVFVDAGDNSVTISGTIEWKAPDTTPDAGTYEAEYTFKPYAASNSSWENNYNIYEGKVTVTVNKAKAKLVDVPVPGEVIYNPDLPLSVWLLNESAKEHGHVEDIKGNWIQGSWQFTDTKADKTQLRYIGVGTRSYEIHFEPNLIPSYGGDPVYANYDFSDIKATVNITVKKGVPYIDVQPKVNAYTHGDYLYNQNLSGGIAIVGDGTGEASTTGTKIPGTFTWKTPSTQLSHVGSNGKEYEYVFTPDDTTCYEIATGKITITVNKAEYPPLMPGSRKNVARSCAKVSDVELPQGWEWIEADSQKELTVGTAVTAKANYTAEDSANYENVLVSIEITRADCEHTKTEIRKAVKATCMNAGSTGETWCLICEKQLSDGDVIPKDATNHTTLTKMVIRQATTSSEGLLLQECKDCGYRKEVTIPKLPGGNSGGSTAGNDHQQSGGQSDGQNEDQGSGSSSSASPAGTTATPVPAAGGKTQSPAPAPSSAPASKPVSTPAKEPFIKGEDGKEGWQVIESHTDEAEEGETIHVDMNGATTVPGTIFDSIRGRDVTVTFDLGGGILWTVNGLDVTAQNVADIDFGVTTGKQAGRSIPVEVINNVTGERYSMNLTLSYEGEFGFTATLTVNMDAANAGLYANLFYYNPETGKLEFMCAGKIDEAGNTELSFSHASDYTIVIDTEPMNGAVQDGTGTETGTEQDGTVDEPDNAGAAPSGQTADEAADGNSGQGFGNGGILLLIGAVVVVIIAAIGAVYVLRRKKEEK